MRDAALLLRITVHAHPGARQERVELLPDGSFGVWVQARPVEGQANASVLKALGSRLGLRPHQLALARGASGREKLVDLDLPDAQALRARLAAREPGAVR